MVTDIRVRQFDNPEEKQLFPLLLVRFIVKIFLGWLSFLTVTFNINRRASKEKNYPKMTTYISILRGINVGGQKMIKMEALRKTYTELGFRNVTTYVQSGNVIFTDTQDDPQILEQKISTQIGKDFGFEVQVLVLTMDKLKHIIDNNPFTKDADKDQTFLHVTFLSSKPLPFDKASIESKKQAGEEISFSDEAVYLYCPHGYGRTKLNNNFLETKLKVEATTRNWRTTRELLKIATINCPG